MRLKFCCAIIFCFFPVFFSVPCIYAAEDWKELTSDHFIIYFTRDEKFAQDVAHKAENYYERIATDLGYPRYSQFWTWDKRVKIYIYPERNLFLKASGQPQWSEGMADYNAKRIMSYAWSEGFVESLLPHEMAHLIFRDFVGFQGTIPLWLDEGVAQWAEAQKRTQIKAAARQNYQNDTLLSLTDMMNLDIRNITETDKVYIRSTLTKDGERGVLLLSGNNLVNTFYLQSVSLVGFLIEKYGSLSFADFCRQLRDGKNLEEALRLAYSNRMGNLDEFESEWRKYLASQE